MASSQGRDQAGPGARWSMRTNGSNRVELLREVRPGFRQGAAMHTPMRLAMISFVAIGAVVLGAQSTNGPITANPLSAPVEKKGLAVEIRDLTRLPDTRARIPAGQDVNPAGWARVSFVRDLP